MSSPSPESLPPTDRHGTWHRQLLWLGLIVLPFGILAAAHWSYLPLREAGDYAQYMLHAKAIAEGRPYDNIGYLYTPYNLMIGPRVQPPGWPLLLAPGVALFGTGTIFPKVLVTLFTIGLLAAVAVRMGRSDERWLAVATAAAVGAGLESSLATNSALSDLPFAAMLWGLCVIADIDRPLSWRRVMAIGLIGSYAMSVRVIGVAIVPAVLLLALVRPRDRTRLLALCGTWLLLGLTAILVVGIDRVPFLRLALRGPGVLFGRLAAFWPKYQYSVFESLLYPTPWDVVNDAYHVAVLAIIPLGLYVFVRRFGRSALGCLSVTYLAIAMLAPVADLRYLWPLWPVLAYSLFAGLRLAASWIPRWSTRLTRLLPAGAALLLVGTVISALQAEPRASLLNRAEVQDLFTWIREAKSREPMRVLFISPRVLTLETGVPAMGFFNARPENIVSEFERVRITHVIIGDAGTSHPSTDGLHELMRERAASFDRQYANAEFTVYRVHDLSPPPGI